MAGGATGRNAFVKLAPPGHRIRMMEPGEAEALHALASHTGLFAVRTPELGDFVRWLLRHEIFVAECRSGSLSGFAAARDAIDLYWISAVSVDAAARGQGVRKALLSTAVARAGWFFHRAVGLAASEGEEADWYRRRRFLSVAASDRTAALEALAAEMPGIDADAAGGHGSGALVGTERTVMLHWL